MAIRRTPDRCSSFRVVEEVSIRCVVSPELRSCVKVEVAFLGSPSPNRLYGLCGRTATFEEDECCVLFVVATGGRGQLC